MSQVRCRPVNRARWARLLAGSLAETPEQGRPPAEATPSAVGPPPYIFGYIRVSDFERQENSEAVQEDLIDKRAAIADIPGTYVGCLVDYLSSKQFPFDYYKHPPFGKRTEVYTDESGRRQKRWVRDEQQCQLLLEIYRLHHTQGWSMAQIAELLDRRWAKDQKGSPWSWRRPCNGTWQVNKLRKAVEYVRSLLQEGKEL